MLIVWVSFNIIMFQIKNLWFTFHNSDWSFQKGKHLFTYYMKCKKAFNKGNSKNGYSEELELCQICMVDSFSKIFIYHKYLKGS